MQQIGPSVQWLDGKEHRPSLGLVILQSSCGFACVSRRDCSLPPSACEIIIKLMSLGFFANDVNSHGIKKRRKIIKELALTLLMTLSVSSHISLY